MRFEKPHSLSYQLKTFANLSPITWVMVASKIDVANKDKVAALKRYCKKHKLKLYEISAVTGKGIEELKYAMAKEVEALREKARQQAETADSPSA